MSTTETLEKINFKKLDPDGIIGHIEAFPENCRAAFGLSKDFSIPSYYIKPKKIVLLGMGGSGQTLEIVKDLLFESNLILECVHNYILPGWVDRDTLVIASSKSGNTEEVLAGFIAAFEKGAKLLAITSGGKLEILARKYDAPVFTFDYDAPPRAAFPYLFIPLLLILRKLGHLQFEDGELGTIFNLLDESAEKYLRSVSVFENPAKILAQKIYGKIPVVYASEKLHGVAMRWKADINENGKNFAFDEPVPELNHKSLEALAHPAGMVYVLSLESNFEYDRNQIRENVTAEILAKHKVPVERIKFIKATDRLSEIFLQILFSGFVSYYLAILNNENPGEGDTVDYLKSRLN